MSFSPNSPQVIRGGIVILDPASAAVQRTIALQYNPANVSRSLQAQWYEPQPGADRGERLRIKGPPIETITLEAEIDATDDLETPGQHDMTAQYGIQPALAALETLLYPPSAQLESNNQAASRGTLEIVPVEAPLSLFVWSKQKVMPVRITSFSVTEEFFDTKLNPIQAKVNLSMRVLTVDDLGFDHLGGRFFMQYQKRKEQLAGLAPASDIAALGLEALTP